MQKLDAFIRRGVRLTFYSQNDPTMAELVDELDETLFTAVLHHVHFTGSAQQFIPS